MPKISYENIINAHKGKVGIAMATGPSAIPFLETFENLSINAKDKYCFLSVNEYDSLSKVNCDYRVVANSHFTIGCQLKRFNNSPSTLLYADSVDCTDKFWVESRLKCNYLNYDQRHFNSSPCVPVDQCCNNIVLGKLTIQEHLAKYTNYPYRYEPGSTVTLHMIAFAILMGCNPIYVTGFDLDYSKGYLDRKLVNHNFFSNSIINEILRDLLIIRDSANNIGVKIYSSSEGSPSNHILEYKPFSINNE